MTDYRIFRDGSTKSHIYVAGERESVGGCQVLRHYDSADLPVLSLDDDIADMCSVCAKAVWRHQL